MDYYKVTDLIKGTESKGQELLVDSFIIGVALGRGELKTEKDIELAIEQLRNLKKQIDLSNKSPFERDDLFTSVLQQNKPLLEREAIKQSKVKKSIAISNTNPKKKKQKNDKQEEPGVECVIDKETSQVLKITNQKINQSIQQAIQKSTKN